MMKGRCCVHHFWAHGFALKHTSCTDSELWTSTSKQKNAPVGRVINLSPPPPLLVVINLSLYPVVRYVFVKCSCTFPCLYQMLLPLNSPSPRGVSLQTKGRSPVYLSPAAFLHALTLILSVRPRSNKHPKSDLSHSILWFIKLMKVLLDMSCEEGCIPRRPGTDVYGRLFKSFVRSAAGCRHKLLSDITTFIFTVACY